MTATTNRLYRVWDEGNRELLMIGTLAQCYEAYPTLACVEVGQTTSRGLWLEKVEW